jgi:hypothetical protein
MPPNFFFHLAAFFFVVVAVTAIAGAGEKIRPNSSKQFYQQ